MLKPLDRPVVATTAPRVGAARHSARSGTAATDVPGAASPSVRNQGGSGSRGTKGSGVATDTIRLVLQNSLPMLVQRELEWMILNGELRAGAKINEADVALRLGVSRGPVREAFRALEESGLVRLEKNRGVFVRQVSIEEADEIYELRALFDEFIGRRVAQSIQPPQVAELRSLVAHMDQAAEQRDLDAYHHANLAFHDRLVELAGNAKLVVTYRRLVNELNLYRRATLAQSGSLPVSSREHHEIVDKIAAHKAAAAGRALYQHVLGSRERMHRATGAPATPKAGRARKAR
jgi:phosphonate utilization transcriptional regulator